MVAAAYCLKAYAFFRNRRAFAIAAQYDLPFGFYQLFLDTDYYAYSCGVFPDSSASLEMAQRRKFELLARKLAAEPGHHVVDVGCGWGSFLRFASEIGLSAEGITLSQRQVAECQRQGFRVSYADAAERVPGPADRVISVGMMEHAKDRRGAILANCFDALRPGGRMVVQEMCRGSERGSLPAAVFVAEEFFPGDYLGTYGSVQQHARGAGFEIEHVECLGRHYYRTALEWARRLARRFEDAEVQVGFRSAMTHLLCQAGFAWYFNAGVVDLLQYVLVKPGRVRRRSSGCVPAPEGSA
jgi:cyclopropane-fatty-acyl-phospholipid synthase